MLFLIKSPLSSKNAILLSLIHKRFLHREGFSLSMAFFLPSAYITDKLISLVWFLILPQFQAFTPSIYRTDLSFSPSGTPTPSLLSSPQSRSSKSYPSSKKVPFSLSKNSQQNFHGTLFIFCDNDCFTSYTTVNYVNILPLGQDLFMTHLYISHSTLYSTIILDNKLLLFSKKIFLQLKFLTEHIALLRE